MKGSQHYADVCSNISDIIIINYIRILVLVLILILILVHLLWLYLYFRKNHCKSSICICIYMCIMNKFGCTLSHWLHYKYATQWSKVILFASACICVCFFALTEGI